MKVRISATIDEKTEKILDLLLKEGKYRNKSHIIEDAINLLKKEVENDKNKK
jgi:Arc/MetJ-type ribon-helix-helix transcriptional regulator